MVFVQLVVTDDFVDIAENNLLSDTDDLASTPVFVDDDGLHRTSTQDDIAGDSVDADASIDLDGTEQELRTNPGDENPEEDSSSNTLTSLGEDYNSIPDKEVVPLDWTTLDKGLKDLDSLMNLIDEGSTLQANESQVAVAPSEGAEDEPSKPKYPCLARAHLLADLVNLADVINGNDSDKNASDDEVSDANINSTDTANSTDTGNSTDTTNSTREANATVATPWVAQTRIVNASELLELVTSKIAEPIKEDNNSTNTTSEGHCVFVMFYAPWCKFSAASAPHFNAIGRAFADIDVIAVDAFQFRR